MTATNLALFNIRLFNDINSSNPSVGSNNAIFLGLPVRQYLQCKFKLLAGKFTCWVMSTFFKKFVDNAQQCFALLHLKQIFMPTIWIFTEDEGDGIESMLSFKIFSTLIFQVILLRFYLKIKSWSKSDDHESYFIAT